MSHVALLIPTLDRIGGAERQLILLAYGLRSRGWRVSVITLSGAGGDVAVDLASAGILFLTLEMRKGLADPRGWIRLNRWLRRGKPEIVHAHLPHAAWMARWSRLAAPVRVAIDTIHSSSTGTLGRRVGYRWSRWLPDRVTAVGEAVRQAHLDAGMVSPRQIAVIPNGVDTQLWKPDAGSRAARRREMGLTDEFLWLAVGRLEPVKDYPTMLRAFAQAPGSSLLIVAGSGPQESELRSLSVALGIARRVRFLGFEPDVRAWMQAADGFLLTSLLEGLPMGLIEAGASALPAVATDVAGTGEVIADGQTGWLAPARSSSAVAEKMTILVNAAAEERRAMGERARQRVVGHYSLDAVLDRWETLYDELLALNPAPRHWGRGDGGGPS